MYLKSKITLCYITVLSALALTACTMPMIPFVDADRHEDKILTESIFNRVVKEIASHTTKRKERNKLVEVQAQNKSEKCLIKTSELVTDEDALIDKYYWDGECLDGYAHGLGRIYAKHLKSNKISSSIVDYISYDDGVTYYMFQAIKTPGAILSYLPAIERNTKQDVEISAFVSLDNDVSMLSTSYPKQKTSVTLVQDNNKILAFYKEFFDSHSLLFPVTDYMETQIKKEEPNLKDFPINLEFSVAATEIKDNGVIGEAFFHYTESENMPSLAVIQEGLEGVQYRDLDRKLLRKFKNDFNDAITQLEPKKIDTYLDISLEKVKEYISTRCSTEDKEILKIRAKNKDDICSSDKHMNLLEGFKDRKYKLGH